MLRRVRLVWDLACNDWRLFFSDRRAALLCFTLPILLASVFGLIFDRPGQRMATTKLPLIVVMEDDSKLAQSILDDLRHSDHTDVRVMERASAEAELARRSTGVVAIIPRGFDQIVTHPGTRPDLELLQHPLSAIESQWAEGILTEVIMKRVAQEYLAPLGMAGSVALERPFSLHRTAVPSEMGHPFNSYSHSFCGMTLQYLLFWGMESGLLLLRERQRGIWRRMRTAPVPLISALFGRALATASIALLQLVCTFSFGYLIFGVTVSGSWLGFFGLAVAVSILAAAMGLFVAAVGGTEARARSVFIVAILTVSMLGGLWLPAFLLPAWVQTASQALPTTWAMRGLDGVTWQGSSLGSVLPCLLAVGSFSVLFLTIALGRFLWSESRRRLGVAL